MTTKKTTAKASKGPAKGAIPRKKREVPAHIKAAADRAEARAKGKSEPEVSDEGLDPAIKAEIRKGATKKATKGPAPKGGTKKAKLSPLERLEKERDELLARLEALHEEHAPVMGRPTKYKPEFALVARVLCKRGATDYEIAAELGVDPKTVSRWKVTHDDFCQALKIHKEDFDDSIERSLAMRASGYEVETEKVFCSHGRITRAKTSEYIAPDVGAIKLWLTNRRPDKWRDKSQTELTGKDGGAIEVVSTTRERVANEIEKLRKRKQGAK